jgi:hypothetical protein
VRTDTEREREREKVKLDSGDSATEKSSVACGRRCRGASAIAETGHALYVLYYIALSLSLLYRNAMSSCNPNSKCPLNAI